MLASAALLALVSFGCGGGGGGGEGGDLLEADLPDGATLDTVPAGDLLIANGGLQVPDETWTVLGKTWKEVQSAALQLAVATNWTLYQDNHALGNEFYKQRVDVVRKSTDLLAAKGAALAALAGDTLQAASDLRDAAPELTALWLSTRDAAVLDSLKELGEAAAAQAQVMSEAITPMEAAADPREDALVDAALAASRAGATFAVVVGGWLLTPGDVSTPAPASDLGGAAVEGADLLAVLAGGQIFTGMKGPTDPDGEARSLPLGGEAVPLPVGGEAPRLLVLRGDGAADDLKRRLVAAGLTEPANAKGALLTLSFPDAASANLDTQPLAGLGQCWLPENAATPDCADSKSGLFPEGAYFDPDTGEYFVSDGLSEEVARLISANLGFNDIAVPLPELEPRFSINVSSLSPEAGPPGTSITVTGSGFGKDPSALSLSIHGGWLTMPVTSLSETSFSFNFPLAPNAPEGPFCHFRGFQDYTIAGYREGQEFFAGYFQLNGLPGCAPSLYYTPFPNVASVGDEVSLFGIGFSPEASQNLIDLNGQQVKASRYEEDEFWASDGFGSIYFTVPKGASSGNLKVKRLDGVDAWSAQDMYLEIREPTVPELNGGLDAAGLFVPAVVVDRGGVYQTFAAQPHTWLLGGKNLMQLRGGDYTSHDQGIFGVEVSTRLGQARAVGLAVTDERLHVTPPVEILAGLQEGEDITLTLVGWELYNSKERRSAPLVLPVRGTYVPGNHRVFHSELPDYEAPAWENPVLLPKGGTLFIAASENSADTIEVSGVVNQTVRFMEARSLQPDVPVKVIAGRAIPLPTAGTLSIRSKNGGKTIQAEVRDEGCPGSGTWPPEGPGLQVADDGLRLGCGGVIVTVPPGALPKDPETGTKYSVTCFHQAVDLKSDIPQLGGGSYRTSLKFTPEPPKLLKPITLEIPFSMEGRTTPPELGLMDEAVGLYANVDAVYDLDRLVATLELPAADYGPQAERMGKAPGDKAGGSDSGTWGSGWVNTASLNTLVKSLWVYSWIATKGTLKDEKRKLQVDWVSEPGAYGQVSDAFAQMVFDTAVLTWDKLVGNDWLEPDGLAGGWLTITITDMGPAEGTQGSTTKGVFGQPWVKINSNLTIGKRLKTTVAHEMGHAFQRQLTTNILTQWVDEASANYIAVFVLGSEADITEDISWAPSFIAKTFPTSFKSGYTANESYAAGAWAVWIGQQVPAFWSDLYKKMSYDPTYWYDSYGSIQAEAGLNQTEVAHQFGKAYWGHELSVVKNMSLNQKTQDFALWAGASYAAERPSYSSYRVDVRILPADLAPLNGSDLVLRSSGLDSARYLYVYTDDKPCAGAPGNLALVGELGASTPDLLLPAYDAKTVCYRVTMINATHTGGSMGFVLASPHIQTLSPSTGKNDGGYAVTITGGGFGTQKGQVTVMGFEQYVSQWSDTSITFTMFNAGSFLGSRDVKVITKEYARSNVKAFDFVD
jgi:hypothetical protein